MNSKDLFVFLNTSNSNAIQTIAIREPRSTMTQLEKFHIVFLTEVYGFSYVANIIWTTPYPQIIN